MENRNIPLCTNRIDWYYPQMDLEVGAYAHVAQKESWKTILTLAYQSLGVVYGDLSISPLYVYRNTFAGDIEHSDTNEEIYGVELLHCILYYAGMPKLAFCQIAKWLMRSFQHTTLMISLRQRLGQG